MDENTHATSGPASGGLIRLQAQLTGPHPASGPAWAMFCGVIASNGFTWKGADWLQLALLVLLVDGGWGTLWAALGNTDWAAALDHWRDWRRGDRITAPPYTLPDSPSDRIVRWIGQIRSWGREVLWPTCGPALATLFVALVFTLILALQLGPALTLLSIAALAVMQMGLVFGRGRGTVPPAWNAAVALLIPWLAGHAAFGSLDLYSAGLALVFTLAQVSSWKSPSRWGRGLTAGGQILAAIILISLHHPVAAGSLILMLVPQILLLPWLEGGQAPSWYVRHARLWIKAAMLIAAWAL